MGDPSNIHQQNPVQSGDVVDLTSARANELAMVVRGILKQDPFCGHLFAFRGRKANLVKILFRDGSGLCLFTKRLEQWRKHHNTIRPHSAPGYRPPAPESIVPMDRRPTMH